MEEIKIEIGIDQHLEDVLPEIPANVILHKTICGCGATTMEIEADRNSIIIEPHVPVIVGKGKKYDSIIGVTEKKSKEDVLEYITNNKNLGKKKIVTTPEGFSKVRWAMRKARINMYQDYFLLFDECEKLIQDTHYRKTITLPIEDFFKFQNKAMVSATPIIPSAPQFEEQEFGIIKIVPNYDHLRNLDLCITNNVLATLHRVLLEELANEPHIFIFYNSIQGIKEVMEVLNIENETNIYCNSDSAEKLYSNEDFDRAYDTITKLNKYNFITSRFYSAVDIELGFAASIVMISEVCSYPYTMIDPQTEAIQIHGRFRDGVARFIHVTNYNKKIKPKTQEEVTQFLNEQHTVYAQFVEMLKATYTKGGRKVLFQALDRVDYNKFALSNGDKNYFMYDNELDAQRVTNLYKDATSIKRAYDEANAFTINHIPCRFLVSDHSRKLLNNTRIKKETRNELAFNQIVKLANSTNPYEQQYLKIVEDNYSLISKAYSVLGEAKVRQIGFKDKDLKIVISSDLKFNFKVRTSVYKVFRVGETYTNEEINRLLGDIFQHFGLPYKRSGMAYLIGEYFVTTRRKIQDKNGDYQRGYELIARRF